MDLFQKYQYRLSVTAKKDLARYRLARVFLKRTDNVNLMPVENSSIPRNMRRECGEMQQIDVSVCLCG